MLGPASLTMAQKDRRFEERALLGSWNRESRKREENQLSFLELVVDEELYEVVGAVVGVSHDGQLNPKWYGKPGYAS